MEILAGPHPVDLPDAEVRSRSMAAERVVIDVGTGDGKAARRRALANPSWLVIGLDPAAARMAATAARARRRPAKGGCPNVIFTVATAEDPPTALHGLAHEVSVNLPWSGLLRGIVRGDAAVLAGLRTLCCADGEVVVVIGTDIWREPVPTDVIGVPVLHADDARGPLADRYRRAGLSITSVEELTGEAADGLPTSWGRRLRSSRADAGFVVLRATPTGHAS